MSVSNIVDGTCSVLQESAPWALLGVVLGIVIIWPPYPEEKKK